MTFEPKQTGTVRVYISGPMTGLPEFNAPTFTAYELTLTKMGYMAVNPHHLDHDHGKTWGEFMRVDLDALLKCHEIHLLPGWENSRGANLEKLVAESIGLVVHYV